MEITQRFSELNRHAIQPALLEVNGLADFEVSIRPRKRGKRVVGVSVAWCWKDKDGQREARKEYDRPRVGRKARIEGAVEAVAPLPSLTEAEIEKGYAAAAKMGVRLDKHAIYEDWRRLVASFEEPPANLVAHFVAFCKEQARMLR